jgi:hypothetical protein
VLGVYESWRDIIACAGPEGFHGEPSRYISQTGVIRRMKYRNRLVLRGAAVLIALAALSLRTLAQLAAQDAPVPPVLSATTKYGPHREQEGSVPAVRAIGVLRSTNPDQSRAILQFSRDAPLEFAEGQAVVGSWSVQRIHSDSVEITDGSRVVRLPVVGGNPHPALLQEGIQRPEDLIPKPPAGVNVSEQVMRDAATRRMIHALHTD